MTLLNDVDRINLCSYFPDIIKAICNKDKHATELIRPIIPAYTFRVNYRMNYMASCIDATRYFSVLNPKKSGKNRVYVSMRDSRIKVFMFYVSKRYLTKLCNGVENNKWVIDLFGDRWIITIGTCRFHDILKLVSKTVALERTASKSNKPPIGNSPDTWIHTEAIIGLIAPYISIPYAGHVYSVDIQKYVL